MQSTFGSLMGWPTKETSDGEKQSQSKDKV